MPQKNKPRKTTQRPTLSTLQNIDPRWTVLTEKNKKNNQSVNKGHVEETKQSAKPSKHTKTHPTPVPTRTPRKYITQPRQKKAVLVKRNPTRLPTLGIKPRSQKKNRKISTKRRAAYARRRRVLRRTIKPRNWKKSRKTRLGQRVSCVKKNRAVRVTKARNRKNIHIKTRTLRRKQTTLLYGPRQTIRSRRRPKKTAAIFMLRGRLHGKKARVLRHWTRRSIHRRRQLKFAQLLRKPLKAFTLNSTSLELYAPIVNRKLGGSLFSKQARNNLNRTKTSIQWNHNIKITNRRAARSRLALRLRPQKARKLYRVRAVTAIQQLESNLVHNPLQKTLLTGICSVDRLSKFDKRKRRLVLGVRLVKANFSASNKSKPHVRLTSRRKRTLLRLKRAAKWTTKRTGSPRSQKRAYWRAARKKIRPRGRYWFRIFRKPGKATRRKKQNVARLTPKLVQRKRLRLFSRLKLSRTYTKNPVIRRKRLKSKRSFIRKVRKTASAANRVLQKRVKQQLKLRPRVKKQLNKWLKRKLVTKTPLKKLQKRLWKQWLKKQIRRRLRRKLKIAFARKLLQAAKGILKARTMKRSTTSMALTKWKALARNNAKTALLCAPYLVPHYRLKSRLMYSRIQKFLTKEQQLNQKNANKDRTIAANRIYRKRAKALGRWNKRNPKFRLSAALKSDEINKRGIDTVHGSDLVSYDSAPRIEHPAVLGARRLRPVFVVKFNKNRWWRPTALPLPHSHPFGLTAQTSAPLSRPGTAHQFRGEKVRLTAVKASEARARRKNIKNQSSMLLGAVATLAERKNKEKLAANFSNRSAFVAERNTLKGNTLWRLLDRNYSGSKKRTANSNRGLHAATAALESGSVTWRRYSKQYSPAAAAALRQWFINSAPRWLCERPIEKFIENWSLRTWSLFKQFVEQQTDLSDAQAETASMFRARFIKTSRFALFAQFPNWYYAEAKARLSVLLREMDMGNTPSAVIQAAKAYSTARTLFSSQAGHGWQEKKLLTFYASRPSRDYFVASTHKENSNTDLTDKELAPAYYNWLTSVGLHLKKTRKALSSQDYNSLRGDFITSTQEEQPRFPGRGRQKHTFDALLRQHYGRSMPIKRRRLAQRTLGKLKKASSLSLLRRLPRVESQASRRRGRKAAQALQSRAYLSSIRRELANRAGKQNKGQNSTIRSSKTRFTALPLRLLKKAKTAGARRLRSREITSFTGATEALLQSALRKRFVTRRIRDLRKVGARRKFAQKRQYPFWIQRKRDKRALRASRVSKFFMSKLAGRGKAKLLGWTFSEFALQAPKRRAHRSKLLSPSGELLTHSKRIKRRYRIAINRGRRTASNYIRKSRKALQLCARVKRGRSYKYKIRKTLRRGYSRGLAPKFAEKAQRKLLQRLEKAQRGLRYSFVKRAYSSTVLGPLHFQRPTSQVFATAEDKERWRLHIQATRLRKYRRLTEVAETLTTFFPQLIHFLLEKKLAGRQITRETAEKYVAGIYWSLRMYLNNKLTHKRANRSNATFKKTQLLKKELTALSDTRYFDLASLRAARFRFQPYTLHRAGSLRRGALAWLRQFLPNFYELYLEDPEKYKHLTLTPVKVFRSHVASPAAVDWETRKVHGTMEQQYHRLTTVRYGANSPRFENMLMTTRRTPILGGYGAASALQVISPVGSSSVRKSFFARPFSSATLQPAKETAFNPVSVLISRAELLRRHSVSEVNAISHNDSLVARVGLKNRAVAKALAHHISLGRDSGAGALDVRLTRAKSPRNTDYLKRLPLVGDLDATTALAPYHDFLNTEYTITDTTELNLTRGSRAVSVISVLGKDDRRLMANSAQSQVLENFRQGVATNRTAGLLKARFEAAKTEVAATHRRLYTKPGRSDRVNLADELSSQKQQTSSKTTDDVRSILHSRKAGDRVNTSSYKTKPAVIAQSVQIRRKLWNSLQRWKFASTLAVKHEKQKRRFFRLSKIALLFRAKKKKTRRVRTLARKVAVAARKIVTGLNVIAVSRLLSAPRSKRIFNFRTKKPVTAVWPTKSRFMALNFIDHAEAIHQNLKLLSKHANIAEKARARHLFSERRPQLWNMLTLRWNKKFRYLKKWLRDIKYAFKQHYWSYEGTHILPDELFKLARIRLRKLDWRESDELFYRDGLKTAFTFHPREKANATWLEPLILKRSLYNMRRGEYRRYQFPREQKHRKWLQKVRKLLYRNRPSRTYIKRRRWPTLRMYNQRLYRSAFRIRNSKAALKRFRKLGRRRACATGFEKLMSGFGDRLDINLMLLGIAPTVYWARAIARMGVFTVNGKVIWNETFRFSPGDFIQFNWEKIKLLRIPFKSPARRVNRLWRLQESSLRYPGNFEYYPKLRAARYVRLPRPEDLSESARLTEQTFRYFQLDSGVGH